MFKGPRSHLIPDGEIKIEDLHPEVMEYISGEVPDWIDAMGGTTHTHANKTQLDLITDGDHDVQTNNPHGVTKGHVSLSNVLDVQQIPVSEKGSVNGVASLDSGGFIPLAQLPAAAKGSRVEIDITSRDAIISGERYEGLHVLVLDASSDTTVTSGGATYVLKSGLTNTDWEKTSEEESLDFDHSEWFHKPSDDTDDITMGATNKFVTQAQIDTFHGHSNKSELDKVTDGDHDIRSDNPHNVGATQISDFDTEVENNTDVAANTSHLHNTDANPHDTKATQITDFQHNISSTVEHTGVPDSLSGEFGLLNAAGLPIRSGISPADVADVDHLHTDILINSLEIAALKATEMNPDLSLFVDSFDDADSIDAESSNYELNASAGHIGLVSGGSLTLKDTTKTQFDGGSFINGESIQDVGGDGAIRKEQTVEGSLTQLEDFENISNVVTTGSAIQAQSSSAGTVQEGVYSLKIAIDFAEDALDEETETEIDLGVGGVDMSTAKYLNIPFLKQSANNIKCEIELEDDSSNVYTYPEGSLAQSYSYQVIVKDLTGTLGSLDKTEVRYIRVRFLEQATGQVLVENIGQLDNDHDEVNQNNSIKQNFIVQSAAVCQRIKLRIRWEGTQPNAALNIAVANVFETTLGVVTMQPGDASGTWTEYILTLDNAFNLVPGNVYSILIESACSLTNAWDIHIDVDANYTDGTYYHGGGIVLDDLHFTLYTPAVIEDIYMDNIELEAESTYEEIATFTSRDINLGSVPSTLDLLYWTENPSSYDTIEVRVRFAATQGGLSSASWSGWFSDATGVGNSLVGITPYHWFQYEVRWTGGSTSETDIVKDVKLDYSVPSGSGSATIISIAENTVNVPDSFKVLWEDIKGTGSINYYISRDGKSTWQSILESQKGDLVAFTSNAGTQIHLKAIVTGNARMYGWTCATNEEFI